MRASILAIALAVGCVLLFSGETARVEAQTFEPQLKINHIDTSKAPLIRVFGSVLGANARPVDEKLIRQVRLYRKPERGSPEELFAFIEDELQWPKSMDEAEIKKKEEAGTLPELAFAGDLEEGAAIVVVAPGFQDLEYRAGVLGGMAKSAAALFFKKLGPSNAMNLIWYNDFVSTFVFKRGYDSGLTAFTDEIAQQCRKWERDQLRFWGLTPEEVLERLGDDAPPETDGPKPDETACNLHQDYSRFPDFLARSSYEGYWPQLFGLGQLVEPCQVPEFPIRRTGIGRDGDDTRVQALDLALEQLTRGARPGQPRILILTGDGRDGYINALEECRFRFESECDEQDDVKRAARRATDWQSKRAAAAVRRECIDKKMEARARQVIGAEQGVFARKLPVWIGLAKAANIRIYSVIHPTAPPYARERLELLAWRTGGTPRFAKDANEVGIMSDALADELNNQIVLTFHDDTVEPLGDVEYMLEARAGRSNFRSDFFKVLIPPSFEPGLIASVRAFGEAKLGKIGFLIFLIVVALIILVVLIKLIGKLFGGGEKAAKKAAKGGKGADKAKAKALAKAKKLKEAKKKAAAKAKKGG